MATTGTPFVFVGSTEGDLRAYTMSESDGSLSAAGSIQLSALGFFTVGPQQDPGSEVRTIFVSSGNSVAAVDYDPTTQMFTLGPTATTSGGGTHVTTDPSGSSVMVAHYGQDALSFFGYDGAGFSAEQPFAPGDNAHQARFREGKVYVPCLGSNHIAQFDWTAAPQLAVATPASAAAAGGPRHMDFHPTQPVAYVLAELSSEIHVYDIAADGSLSLRGDASLFTHEDGEYHWSSDIKVTPDGRFVYAVNRDPSEVVLFTVGDDFNLTRGASTPLVGEVRSFGMDPKGSFLQIGSKDGILQTLSINPSTGALTAGPSQSGLGTIHNTEVHYFELP